MNTMKISHTLVTGVIIIQKRNSINAVCLPCINECGKSVRVDTYAGNAYENARGDAFNAVLYDS